MKNRHIILSLFVLGCLELCPVGDALNPPPDGGYPGGNTAEGQGALSSLFTGIYNTAVGFFSLQSLVVGNFNTGVGAGTLISNTGDSNTATGAAGLLGNTTGTRNTADGAFALLSNTTGNDNTADGASALLSNTEGDGNTATGSGALSSNTTGSLNTAVGAATLPNNTTGNDNTAVGLNALFSNTTANNNTAVGRAAMGANTTGNNNTAIGWSALAPNTTGTDNTAVGFYALQGGLEDSASRNTAVGSLALASISYGLDNTAIGYGALQNESNIGNTAVGVGALATSTCSYGDTAVGWGALVNAGADCLPPGPPRTALGSFAGSNVVGAVNVVCIHSAGADVSNSCYIGNIWSRPGGAQAVYVNSEGKLGVQVSSQRFKEEIRPMDQTSEAIYSLKPVTFRYKKEIEPTRPIGFGLIAEDVDKISHELVSRDTDGKPNSVHYDAVNAMLLNEFLKAHRKMEQQQKQIDGLTAQLKGQAAQIQKVSTRIELSKPEKRLVLHSQ